MAWQQISEDAMTAAKSLAMDARWRSVVSRAYYAAYAAVAGALAGRANFPAGRQGPSHDRLPQLVMTYLTALPVRERRLVSTMSHRLYERRIAADYRPNDRVDRAVARASLQDAAAIIGRVSS